MAELTTKQQQLIDMVLRHEGGYVNNKLDKGKETYCGISRAFHPNWEGWSIIDAHKPLKTNQKLDNTLLQNYVYKFYLDKFYNPIKIDNIDNMLIAGHLFCHAVNAGQINAVKIIQKAINTTYNTNIVIDGKIGCITLSWLNKPEKQSDLITEIIKLRKTYYENIVKNKPSQSIFLKGWLNRVNATTAYCTATPKQLGFVGTPKKKKKDDDSLMIDTSDGITFALVLQLLWKIFLNLFKK